MVKGISRQVIVVHAPDPKLFEQAIFILKEDALEQGGVTEEVLLKEAGKLINSSDRRRRWPNALFWALAGALPVVLAWLLTALFSLA